MRPRPEGRGERRAPRYRKASKISFNAATTRRSWRTTHFVPVIGGLGRLQCGHDPKVVENRAARCGRGAGAAPSMRPRPEGRGERISPSPSPRKGRGLQCGHDPKVVENALGFDLRAQEVGPSMRPRPEGRGERPVAWHGRTAYRSLQCGHDPKVVENEIGHNSSASILNPSMRPRPEGRGELHHVDQTGHAGGDLQCGHDPKVVENQLACLHHPRHASQPSMRPRPEGRGERPLVSFARGQLMPFNAATTRRSWRTAAIVPRRSQARHLQCGHDPKVVENPVADFPPRWTRYPSMRPRPEGRGELKRRGTRSHRDSNLQCGHDPKVVENRLRRPSWRRRLRRLQCGHDPKVVENDDGIHAATQRPTPSMRPRPEGRGELRLAFIPAEQGEPSMRPRPEGRGEPSMRSGSGSW